MMLKISSIVVISALIVISCNTATTSTENDVTASASDTTKTVEPPADLGDIFNIVGTDTIYSGYLVEDFSAYADQTLDMIYVSGSLYAAGGEYLFYDKKNKVAGRIWGNREGVEPTVNEPDDMFDFDGEHDGLPPENPNYLGKTFEVTFNNEGVAMTIKVKE